MTWSTVLLLVEPDKRISMVHCCSQSKPCQFPSKSEHAHEKTSLENLTNPIFRNFSAGYGCFFAHGCRQLVIWVLQLVAVDMLVLSAWMVAHRPQRIDQTETFDSVGGSPLTCICLIIASLYVPPVFLAFKTFGKTPVGGRRRRQPGRKCGGDTPCFVTTVSSYLHRRLFQNLCFEQGGHRKQHDICAQHIVEG